MDNIHIACAFDQGMAIPALILAYSVKKFANTARKTIFHVLECSKGAFPSYADYILNSDYFEICRHNVDLSIFEKYDFSISTVNSIATFSRLAIPRIIRDADRVIYLNCDMVINRSLDELFDIDMNDFPLAACRDLTYAYFLHRHDGPSQKAARILFKNVDAYFNAGIMLIDCVKWRKTRYLDSIIEFLANPPAPLFLADQDVLNAIFVDNHLELDPRWNSWAARYEFGEGEEELAGFSELCAENPWIVHFIGRAKPWISFHQKTKFHALYWQLAAESPFISDVIALYNSGPVENTAYAAHKLPAIFSDRHVWEFLFTLSTAAARIESTFRMKRSLSNKIYALGTKIHDTCLASEQAAQNREPNLHVALMPVANAPHPNSAQP